MVTILSKEQVVTILSTYRDKILEHVDPQNKDILLDSMYISGASIASFFLQEPANDIDIFFKYQSSYDLIVKHFKENLFIKSVNRNVTTYTNKFTGIDSAIETKNAFTMILEGDVKIQFIKSYCGHPSDIIKDFDFVHCRAYYTFSDSNLTVDIQNNFYDAVANKKMVYCKNSKPVNSLVRMKKFMNRGWTIENIELIRISLDIASMNLLNPEVMRNVLNNLLPINIEKYGIEINKNVTSEELLEYAAELELEADSSNGVMSI